MAVSQRTIKFRAWDADLQEMLEIAAIYFHGNSSLMGKKPYLIDGHNDLHHLEEVELMQFTSLKDKHGKEIFEGDVLKKMGVDYDVELDYDADPDAEYPIIEIGRDVATMERFPVFWLNNEAFGYEGEDLENPDEWEIIGNVFENPELLENQK